MDEQAKAMAWLRMACGEARDVISWVKRENIPVDTVRAQTLVSELEQCIGGRDFAAATGITAALNREMFKLRASEAAPFVRIARKQKAARAEGRDAHNKALHLVRAKEWERWNQVAAQHWESGASKNSVARIVRSKLRLQDSLPTIARRLKKPRQAR